MDSFESRLRKGFQLPNRKEWKAFLVFLGIAALLWFFQSMGQEYSAEIGIDIQYEQLPENRVFTEEPPHAFQALVKSQGWDLLAYKLSINKPRYAIDLSGISTSKTINSREARAVIEQHNAQLELLSIQPESIDISIEEALEKILPIKSQLVIQPEDGFDLSSYPIFEPDSVRVKGPASLVKKLSYILTDSLVFTEVSASIDENIKLKKPADNVILSITETKCSIPIQELTEKVLHDVPIRVKGYSGRGKVNLIPQIATVTCLTTIGNFNKIERGDIEIWVDFPKDRSDNEMLEIQVAQKSDLISSIRVHPKYVDYFVDNE